MKARVFGCVAAVLAIAACQQAEPADPSGTADAAEPAASAEAVARILAIPVMERCGGGNPGLPPPTTSQVIELGAGAFAVLADCQASPGEPTCRTLHVQGADGVLKAQPLIVYNGPEYDEGFDWEVTQTSEATWDAAAKELVAAWTSGPTEEGPSSKVSTVKWRWDGAKFAMVSAVRVTHATPGAPATGEVTGFPATGKVDPTPAAIPV